MTDKYCVPFTYKKMMDVIENVSAENDCVEITELGKTLLGKSIPCLKFGRGSINILYAAAHHGREWMTSILMMRFAEELCDFYSSKKRYFALDPDYIFESRSVYIIPMLNPDGVDLSINGISPDDPMKERLIKANNMDNDFSAWQANARGVDLNHNYNAGFEVYKSLEKKMGITGPAPTRYSGEYPESEPETKALCGFVRSKGDFLTVISFHTQGEEIYCDFNGRCPPRGEIIGRMLARYSGYRLAHTEGAASYGGFKDWYISEFGKPAFTVECGKGKNPLPVENNLRIYTDIRKMLFGGMVI